MVDTVSDFVNWLESLVVQRQLTAAKTSDDLALLEQENAFVRTYSAALEAGSPVSDTNFDTRDDG